MLHIWKTAVNERSKRKIAGKKYLRFFLVMASTAAICNTRLEALTKI